MAYPIATMADGSILYSDGKKRKSPNYSPASGYGTYDKGFAFDSYSGIWRPVDTSYKDKIPASGYGDEYAENERFTLRTPSGQRADSKKAKDNRPRSYWEKMGIERKGIWSYVDGKRFRSASDAERYLREKRAREMAAMRRQQALEKLASYNPFSPGKAYAASYDQGLNYTPIVQETEERPGLFGLISSKITGGKDYGISEMFGGRMGSLERQGRSLNPFQQYVRAGVTTNPILAPAVATTKLADTAFQKWNNTETVVRGGNAPSESNARVKGAYKVASADSEAPQFTPSNPDIKIGDYTYNKETNQWEKTTESGETVNLAEDLQNQLQQILGTTGEGTTEDFFALLGDEGTKQAIKSEEDARDAIIKQLEAQRDALLANYKTLKGDAKATARSKIDELNRQLDFYRTQGQSAKEELSRGYGELIKQATRGKRMRDLQRRNMFSALGTADSSAFIENQTKADQDFGSALIQTRRDELAKKAAIDRDISNLETWTNKSINDINTKLDNYLQQIKAAEGLAEADKEKLTAEAIASAQNIINQITAEYRNQMYNLMLNQQATMANLLPNLIQAQQLADQMKILEGAGNWRSSENRDIPAGYIAPDQQSSIPYYTWQDILGEKDKKDNQDVGLFAKILKSLMGM